MAVYHSMMTDDISSKEYRVTGPEAVQCHSHVCFCVCMCVCTRACVACIRACVYACECSFASPLVHLCVYFSGCSYVCVFQFESFLASAGKILEPTGITHQIKSIGKLKSSA